MIGWQQSLASRDDPMTVMIRVAGESDVEFILQTNQTLHRIGRRGIHADLAVPIHRHETESGINGLVGDRKVQPIAISNRLPVVDTSPTEGIDTQADLRLAYCVHIDYMSQLVNVGVEIIVAVCCRCMQSFLERYPLHAFQPLSRNILAFASIHLVTVPSAGPPFGGLYLKPPSWGGLWEGVITIPSARPVLRPRL